MKDGLKHSRREMIRLAAVAAGALAMGGMGMEAGAAVQTISGGDPWHGLKVGVASYSLRKLPLEACIKGIRRVNLQYVSIKDFHLPLKSTTEQRKAVAQKFRAAGITPISAGVITMPNKEDVCRNAFEYGRDLGIPTIVCSPAPDALGLLDKLVKEFDIKLAIHNHGPEDKKWPSPYDVLKGIEGHDPRIGICIDVGHCARAGVDPAEAVLKCKERMYDMHMKDIDKLDPKAKEVECGRGVLNLRSIFDALLAIRYGGHVGFEHEKDADDPVPGLAESVGYVKGILAR